MLTFASYDDDRSNEINKLKGLTARSLRPSRPPANQHAALPPLPQPPGGVQERLGLSGALTTTRPLAPTMRQEAGDAAASRHLASA
jgi:hypothetical protein